MLKKTLHPNEKETERVQKLRVEFWEKIRDVPIKDLVFLDEAGVNLSLIRLYGRAPRGQRARGTRPHKRGKNVSMIGAIALSGRRIRAIVCKADWESSAFRIASINLLGSIDGLTNASFCHPKTDSQSLARCSSRLG